MDLGARHDVEMRERGRRIGASGRVTPVLVGLLCLGLLTTAYMHVHGNFHRLKSKVITPDQGPASGAMGTGPGGQTSLTLSRSATALGQFPEFLSAVILPGRGFQLFQIKALLPGHGETSLLASPDEAEATRMMTDAGDDANGHLSTTMGGAMLAPWAERLWGVQSDNVAVTSWNGLTIATPGQMGISEDGLMLDKPSSSVTTQVLSDGQAAEGTFHSWAWKTNWPGPLDVISDVELSGQALEVTLTAKNTGASPAPIGLGWMPMFQLMSGNRATTMLVVPSRERAAVDAKTGRPLGKSESVAGTDQDFNSADGTTMGTKSINSTYVNLQRAVMADGPGLEIRDPHAGYGLRIIPLSDTVTAMHVVSPKDKNWVQVVVETNQADPFGKEWGSPENSGLKVLQPGESFKMRVRLEIFAVSPLSPLATGK